jgi:septal ring factor EnvC (AmiA/AmiB activator)
MVDLSTPVTVTMGKLLTGVALLCGGLWAIAAFTISGVGGEVAGIRDDLKGIRENIGSLQSADRDNITRSNEINSKLTEQIQGLRTDFVKFTTEVGNTNRSVNDLTVRISDLQKQIQASQSTPWADPKFIANVADSLKKEGITGNVVIVPAR